MTRMAAALITLVLSACAGASTETPEASEAHDSHSPVSSASAAPTLQATVEETSEPPAGAIDILLTFGPKFEPDEATAQAGDVVFFLRSDKGDGPPAVHNLLLGRSVDSPPLAASPTLMHGDSGAFTVYRLEAGTYTYWCTMPSPDGSPHWQSGMIGTLTVTE
jgi:plastocyanin